MFLGKEGRSLMSYLLFLSCAHLSAMEIDLPKAPANMIMLKPKPQPGDKMNIDREGRVIDNVIIAEVGEAEGHGFEIETTFLSDVLKYVKKELGGRLQCNMGHRYDANFFQLGRFDNLRLSAGGKQLIGTLTVYEAADNSPALQNMATWFLDLAEEDPEAVMCSMSFRVNAYYQYDDKGVKVYIQGSWYGPIKQFEKKPAYAEFMKIYSCDIVDRGALTSSLFSDGAQNAARMFHDFVSAPDFPEFFKANESQFPFFASHYQTKERSSLKEFISNLFSKHNKEVDTTTQTQNPPAPETTEANATTDVNALIEAAIKPLSDKIDTLTSSLAAKDEEITKLKKKALATTTSVQTEDPENVDLSGDDDEPWMNSPINKKVAQLSAKRKKATA